jgi:hypothetical protein
MNIYRAKHDNVPVSPVRTLYGRKGNLLLLPLDVCVLQTTNGGIDGIDGIDEFRPSPEATRLIAAPIQDEKDGRIGLIAQYAWPPREGVPIDPVVLVQLAPSANVKGIADLREVACQVETGDAIVCVEGDIQGTVTRAIGWCTYPDLTHQVEAYRVEFGRHVDRRSHGAAVRLKSGQLVGMLIATQNQDSGVCRALVYPA